MGEPWTVNMPEEGWGRTVQEYVCEWCGPGREEAVYTHPDHAAWLAERGMTAEEYALEMHRNDAHAWNEETQTWSR